MRAMISPTWPLATPSGLIRMSVRSVMVDIVDEPVIHCSVGGCELAEVFNKGFRVVIGDVLKPELDLFNRGAKLAIGKQSLNLFYLLIR